jgi:hypothetical protein
MCDHNTTLIILLFNERVSHGVVDRNRKHFLGIKVLIEHFDCLISFVSTVAFDEIVVLLSALFYGEMATVLAITE